MSTLREISSGGVLVFVAMALTALLGYATRSFLAHQLSVADFGLYYSLVAFVGFFLFFREFGLSTVLVRFLGTQSHRARANTKQTIFIITVIQLLAVVVITIPILILADYLAIAYFKNAAAALPLRIIVIADTVGIGYVILRSTAQGLGKMRIYAAAEPLRVFAFFASAYLFISYGVLGVAAAYFITTVICLLFLAAAISRSHALLGKASFDRARARQYLAFGFSVYVQSIFNIVLISSATLFLTMFQGTEAVGIYQVALPTAELLLVIATSLTAVLLPLLSSLWAQRRVAVVAQSISLAAKIVFIAAIPFAMLMMAFSEDIIVLLFGAQYSAAAPVLMVLALASILSGLATIFSTSLVAINRPGVYALITIVMAVVNVGLDIVLIPAFGPIAAAFALLASYGSGMVLSGLTLRRIVPLTLPLTFFIRVIFAGVLSLLSVIIVKTFLGGPLFLEIGVALAIAFCVYGISVLQFRALTRGDIMHAERFGVPVLRPFARFARRFSRP